MESSAKDSPSAFSFFDLCGVSEDMAGKIHVDPEAGVDKGHDLERVIMVRDGGSIHGIVRLQDLDSEDEVFDEGGEVDGTTAKTKCSYEEA